MLALVDATGPFFETPAEAFPGASDAAWERARRIDPGAFGSDGSWRLDFRCFVVRRPGGRCTLVDAGVGPAGSPAADWAPVPGHLPELLARAGIGTGDVDTVVLTHLHEDHYGWTVTADGTPVFPDADHLVQRRETDVLADGDTATTHVVRPLREAGLLREIDGRRRISYGRAGSLTLVPTPGHTPGHQSVLAEPGTRDVVITGDVLVHAVQLADPAVAYHYEADPATAARSRRELLDEAGERGALLATAHLRRAFVDAREGRARPPAREGA